LRLIFRGAAEPLIKDPDYPQSSATESVTCLLRSREEKSPQMNANHREYAQNIDRFFAAIRVKMSCCVCAIVPVGYD
jgi:hypothetical protein